MKCVLVMILALSAINVECSNSIEGSLDVNYNKKLSKFGPDGIMEDIQKWIEELIQKANEAIDDIIAKFNEIAATVQAKIAELIEQAKNQLDEIMENIKNILEDLVGENEEARACLDKYYPQLETIIENAKNDLGKCKENALNQLEAIQVKIQEQIDAIKSQIAVLSEVFVNCYESSSSPISAYLCVLKQVTVIKDAVTSIISNATEAVVIAGQEAAEIISTASSCITGTVSDAQSQINEVVDDIRKCIASSTSPKHLH